MARFFSLLCFLFVSFEINASQPDPKAASASFETKALQALLLDARTGKILFAKNADEQMYPSSMTKVMTVYMLFEELKNKKLSLNDAFTISEHAWKMEGSRMFIEVGKQVRVEDLLRGIVVASGNDASVAVAEGIAGSEALFAADMTRRAHEMGAKNTTFKNATGWPDPLHMTTARDLAIIADRMIRDFPEHYFYFKETEFSYNNIRQMNRNPLLYRPLGCDGLKTGHTDAGGYGLVASAIQNDQRLILVINGLTSMGERAREAEALLVWGFKNFRSLKLFAAGQVVDRASVWLGQEGEVPLVADRDIYITIPRLSVKDLKVVITRAEPVAAPLQKGAVVGKITVTAPGVETIEIPLKTGKDIVQAGFIARIKSAVHYLLWGHNQKS